MSANPKDVVDVKKEERRRFAREQREWLMNEGYSPEQAQVIVDEAGPGQVREALAWYRREVTCFLKDSLAELCDRGHVPTDQERRTTALGVHDALALLLSGFCRDQSDKRRRHSHPLGSWRRVEEALCVLGLKPPEDGARNGGRGYAVLAGANAALKVGPPAYRTEKQEAEQVETQAA